MNSRNESYTLTLGTIDISVEHKAIKNIHLSVYPPMGEVKVSAPENMKADAIRVFLLSKLSWIKKEQTKFQNQYREPEREMLNGESHYFWGERYLLEVIEKNSVPSIEIKAGKINLKIRPGATLQKKKEILEEWYRECLRSKLTNYINIWTKKNWG
jgi:predicted metal-dependent hydrolase